METEQAKPANAQDTISAIEDEGFDVVGIAGGIAVYDDATSAYWFVSWGDAEILADRMRADGADPWDVWSLFQRAEEITADEAEEMGLLD